MTSGVTITFRPVTRDDLATLTDWIKRPHWQEWWGDPATEIGYITDMIEGRDTTRPFFFMVDGVDAGYIQYWIVGDQLKEPWLTEAPWMLALPEGTIGVDISIADAATLSRGIGTAVLTAFVARLRAEGHEEIIIDPDPSNGRAVRAYEKSGFRAIPELEGRTGDYLIMRHHGTTEGHPDADSQPS